MKNLKVKIITGFRKDQQITIEADEAHKAYYLFLNPQSRGIFKNGTALIGSEIRAIEPDYNATMKWNATHVLDGDDWNEINKLNVKNKMYDLLQGAKKVVPNLKPEMLNLPLEEVYEGIFKTKLLPEHNMLKLN